QEQTVRGEERFGRQSQGNRSRSCARGGQIGGNRLFSGGDRKPVGGEDWDRGAHGSGRKIIWRLRRRFVLCGRQRRLGRKSGLLRNYRIWADFRRRVLFGER